MKEEFKQYEREPDAFWQYCIFYGDGDDVMALAEKRGWQAIGLWGRDGWDLGRLPYVVVYFRERETSFDIALYCEGDVTMYTCPSLDIRNAITDEIALFYWRDRNGCPTATSYTPELRGPYIG